MYSPVDPKVSFPDMERGVLRFWEEADVFRRSVEQRAAKDAFVFYDGPPFATGLPHFGHFVPGTVKDVIPRYQTMKGRRVERRFGWDCHGLPVEYEMEKELKISGKREIEAYGVARFNEACRGIVLRYTREWREVITRLGRWVDFDHDYKTMDPDYMESIWWVVKRLWDLGLLYESYYILPYCPRCSTVLSNHELNLGGYEEVRDPAITVRFRSRGDRAEARLGANAFFLAWTTTPWTLPSNLALTVGAGIDYALIEAEGARYVLAKDRLGAYYPSGAGFRVVGEMKGEALVGMEYEPLFPYFAKSRESGAFRVFSGDYVTTEEGTGIVHTAPGFGEDDYETLKGSGIPVACPVDGECRFTREVSDYAGLFVKDADKAIIERLREEGSLVGRESHLHSYPHCWRCRSPLIYRAISSWFVNVQKVKERMIRSNATITWMPDHLKAGRFGNWIEGARDWAISRNRYWGNPLPIWRCERCGALECLGSRSELAERSGAAPEDLHKHFVDPITYPCASCAGTMRRISEVLDCWFESGSMPYAQNHYPFENKEHFERRFPADFIAEGLDQTRGWFYTLVVLSAALFDCPPSRAIVVNGLVLAADGKKMSKSERNYSDPRDVMDRFGADALRFFLMNAGVVRAEDLRYSDDGVKEVVKGVILPLWNAYSFFVTYANIDKAHPEEPPERAANPLDRWILSECARLVAEVTSALDRYDLQRACAPIVTFIDLLNNWYIRRSRRRFWRSGDDADKSEAYATLREVLVTLAKVAAPIIPFTTEEIYRNLRSRRAPDSIHLTDYPLAEERSREPELELKMRLARQAVSTGRALRALHQLKIRQPLKALYLVTRLEEERRALSEMEAIIREELNVKEVVVGGDEEELVEYHAKANFRALGKTLGKNMKEAAERVEALSSDRLRSLLSGERISVETSFGPLLLDRESVIVQRTEKSHLKVLNDGTLTVALDPEVSDELKQEGAVRDIIRGVQSLRKERGLEVTDRITLYLFGPAEVEEAVSEFQDYLMEETLAVSWRWERLPDSVAVASGGAKALVSLAKVV